MATDACRALGLNRTASKDLRCADDEKRAVEKGCGQTPHLLPLFQGTTSRLLLLSESALYKLIMRSDKDTALPFQDWVTREVLPSIRKTGSYDMGDHGRTEMPLPGELAA